MRGGSSTPVANVDCGYQVEVTETGVIFYPTGNWNDCNLEIGLGNATFTIDPKNPPEEIKRILTGDSEGELVVKIDYSQPRHTKKLLEFEEKTEEIEDASGNLESFTYMEVISEENEFESGEFENNYALRVWDSAEPFHKILW